MNKLFTYDIRYFPSLSLLRRSGYETGLPGEAWCFREACLFAMAQRLYDDFTGNLDADV